MTRFKGCCWHLKMGENPLVLKISRLLIRGLGANIERLRVPEQLMRVTPALEAQLNERQRKMMQWQVVGKELTTRQCEMEFDVTGPVIAGDFRKLIEMGLAEKFGAVHSTRYRLKVQV